MCWCLYKRESWPWQSERIAARSRSKSLWRIVLSAISIARVLGEFETCALPSWGQKSPKKMLRTRQYGIVGLVLITLRGMCICIEIRPPFSRRHTFQDGIRAHKLWQTNGFEESWKSIRPLRSHRMNTTRRVHEIVCVGNCSIVLITFTNMLTHIHTRRQCSVFVVIIINQPTSSICWMALYVTKTQPSIFWSPI